MQDTIQNGGDTPSQTRREPPEALPNEVQTSPLPKGSGRHVLRGVAARVRRNWLRELWDWWLCRQPEFPTAHQVARCLQILDSHTRTENLDDERPIFLLSTGWRSGSTLLQRILVTDPRVLLWGEPFGETAVFTHLSKMLCVLADSPAFKPVNAGKDNRFATLSTSWIATLYPPGSDFRRGLQAFLYSWLGQSARDRGFSRWGFKEVRLGAPEAILLHWIFPKAKFVLLSRNPFDCYRSLADSGWHHLYLRRPDIRVDSAAGIAKHWNRLAVSWAELPDGFPVFRVKYEDVIACKVDFRELESWLGIGLNEAVALSAHVGSTARRPSLGAIERWIIAHEAHAGIRALGYQKL